MDTTQGIAASKWVAVATLLRPQGRRGELLAEPLTDLAEVFSAGREVVLSPPGAAPPSNASTRHLEAHWFPTGKNAGRVVLQLSGCTGIQEAEALAGLNVLVPSQHMPALDEDTFFVGDLIGCALYDGDRHAGNIVDVEFATAPDGRTRLPDAAPLLAVQLFAEAGSPEAEPVLVPFVRAWLDAVDIANRRITMHLPAGLLEPVAEPLTPKP